MFKTPISTGELAGRIADASLVVVDVRHELERPKRWGEQHYDAGQVPGARFAHIDRDLSAAKTSRNGTSAACQLWMQRWLRRAAGSRESKLLGLFAAPRFHSSPQRA